MRWNCSLAYGTWYSIQTCIYMKDTRAPNDTQNRHNKRMKEKKREKETENLKEKRTARGQIHPNLSNYPTTIVKAYMQNSKLRRVKHITPKWILCTNTYIYANENMLKFCTLHGELI